MVFLSCAARKPFHKFADMSAAPSPYSRQTNFVSSATNNPNITVAQIATPLDAECDAIAGTLNQTVSRLGELQRDDGKLRSGIVSSQTLSTEVLNLLNVEQSTLRGEFAASVAYKVRDVVTYQGGTYMCAVAHTSSSDFATEITNGLWITLQARPANNALRALRFTGTGSQTTFTLTDNTELNATNVFIDGVYQQKDSYTVSGSAVVFDTAPPSGSVIEISYGTIAEIIGIGALSVTNDKIAANAVTSDKIANNAILATTIADGAVISTKIANGAIDASKAASGLYSAIAPTGAAVQSAFAKSSTTATTTSVIPADNTIPQITEGLQVLSASITPSSSTNKIRGRVVVNVSANVAGGLVTAAVFRGSAVNAIASCAVHIAAINYMSLLAFEFEDTPNALTQQVYTIRVGSNATTTTATINPAFFGGTMGSSISLQEIKS